MNVNGSVIPVNYQYFAPKGFTAYINAMHMRGVASGIEASNLFGVAATLITTGLEFRALDTDSVVLHHYTEDISVRRTADFGLFAGGETLVQDSSGNNDDGLLIDWDFKELGGLMALRSERCFQVRVNSDLSGVTALETSLLGFLLPDGVFTDKVPRLPRESA